MIGKAPGLGDSQSESSIRHQVRKLRAKVKSLIPINICGKYQKRNDRVAKLNNFEKLWQKEHTNKGKPQWTPTTMFNTTNEFHASSLYQKSMGHKVEPLLKRTSKLQKTFNNELANH